jgi:cation transport regulator ChaB
MSGGAMAEMPLTHPLRAAWEQYKQTDEYKNTRKWAAHPEHLEGSMWGVWLAAFNAATERAASLHESVDPASDDERANKVPGAGAMGAVIQYRDLIRANS